MRSIVALFGKSPFGPKLEHTLVGAVVGVGFARGIGAINL
jgi:hypothetical protein